MKKLLLLLLLVAGVQGLISQSKPTQYKYLNRLSNDSQIKRYCENIGRGWLYRGKDEVVCDAWDNLYDVSAQNVAQMFNNEIKQQTEKYIKDYNQEECRLFFQSSKWQSFKNDVLTRRLNNQISPLFEIGNCSEPQKEKAIILSLFDEICQDGFSKFEENTISCAKK